MNAYRLMTRSTPATNREVPALGIILRVDRLDVEVEVETVSESRKPQSLKTVRRALTHCLGRQLRTNEDRLPVDQVFVFRHCLRSTDDEVQGSKSTEELDLSRAVIYCTYACPKKGVKDYLLGGFQRFVLD